MTKEMMPVSKAREIIEEASDEFYGVFESQELVNNRDSFDELVRAWLIAAGMRIIQEKFKINYEREPIQDRKSKRGG